MATVRGTFDLNSRPASSALRDLRTEGAETDLVMQRVGKSLDGIGTTKQREQLRLYREGLKRLGRQWEQTAAKADASWSSMEKKTLDAVATQGAAIDDLQGKVNELGRSSPTISVNTRGVSESLAEVELLQRRLNELGRSSPTARVGVGGTASSLGRTVGGGAGRGGFLSQGLKVPFAGSIPYPLVAGALGAAPPLLGGAGALLGSAGAATLGAGAIGIGGLGALSATVGSIAAVAIPAVKGLKESYKALTAYNKAVAINGKNSTQAHTALEKLNAALQGAPSGTRGLLNREQAFSHRFQTLTKPGQSSFIGSLSNILGAGNQLAPQLAGVANPLLGGVQTQSGRLSDFLTGGTTRGFIGAAGSTAISSLPDVESTFQHVLATLMNISHAAMPFFRESLSWLEEWTAGWATSTGNIDKTRGSISTMVSNLKSWGRLTSATFKLIRDLLSAGTGPGQGLVDDLTTTLNTWDRWIQKNPAKVRSFFSEAVSGTEKIASALGKITGLIWKLGQMLTPLLTQAAQFVTFFSEAGLLQPGTLPFLLAGGAGIRNVMGGARGRILGGSGAAGIGGGGFGEAAVIGGALGGGGAARMGLGSRLGGFFRNVKSAGTVPIMSGGRPLTLGMEADAGLIGATRFSSSAAARYGLGRIGSGALSAGGTFLRGAGARFLPLAALMGGLSAASFQGSFGDRFQAGLSGLTAGIVEAPKTSAEKEDEGTRHAQMVANYYAEKYGGGRQGLAEQIQAARRKRHRLLTPHDRGGLTGFLTSNIITGDRQQIVSEEDRKEAEALLKQIEQLQSGRVSQSIERGGVLGSQFRGSFNVRRAHEGGVAALGDVSPEILAKIKHLGPAGGKVLAANVLEWTRAAKQHNPKLKAQYEELVGQITHSFAQMGKHIKIINGEIYEGSQREWGQIRKAMTNPIEVAREEMKSSFTAIQQEAVNVLRAMGYSPSMSHRIVQGMESKNNETREAAEGAAKSGPGGYNQKILRGEASGPPNRRGAYGMRIPGHGNTDHVPIGGATGIGAPDELIVNKHTERRANQLLGMFGATLEGLQRGERKRQSTPLAGNDRLNDELRGLATFARGGRSPGRSGSQMAWRGIGPAGVHQGAKKVAEAIMGHFPGLQATSTTSGGHVSGSYHYLGEAVDIAGATPEMYAASQWIKKSGLYKQLAEGIHNPNLSVSDGRFVDPSFYSSVWAEHANHIHVAVAHEVGRLLGLGGSGIRTPGGTMRGRGHVRLHGRRSGLGGVPGALAEAGSSHYARGLQQKLNQRIGRGRGGFHGQLPTGGSVPSQIARVLLSRGLNKIGAAGIIGNAYAESSWDPSATGYGGGGLWGFTSSPNSLADLQSFASGRNQPWTNAALQTEFLLKHVSRGLISQLNASTSPEAAAALFMREFERPGIPRQNVRESGARRAFSMGFSHGGRLPSFGGWFARGGSGTVSGPTLLGLGENGKEDFDIRPHRGPRRPGRARLGGGHHVEVKFEGPIHVRSDADIDALADKVGRKLIEAMNQADRVDQAEVIG